MLLAHYCLFLRKIFLTFRTFRQYYKMKAFIISIGEEMLIGQTVNTNAAWMASRLNEAGIEVEEIRVITDDREAIYNTLLDSIKRCDLILITGGLGPTRDDVTRDVLCKFFKSSLELNQQVLNDISKYLKDRGRRVSDLNRDQAMVPVNAEVIRNPLGTAPGLWFREGEKHCVAMPGVPYEMKEMMSKHVIPSLVRKVRSRHILHKTVLTQGIGESDLAKRIENWEKNLPDDVQLAYLPSTGIVKMRLTTQGGDLQKLEAHLNSQLMALQGLIPQYIWGYDDDTLEKIVGRMLVQQGSTISTAESCTGGYIAHRITGVPGSSAYFTGSIIAYDNRVKEEWLRVPRKLLKDRGAVSREVAEAMALGVSELLKTMYGIGVTGIAGPGGETKEKPVGTTWIAVAMQGGKVVSRKFQFGDNRERNIIRAGNAALAMLREQLAGCGQQPIIKKEQL